jgi:beta-lactamase regulating signal transducer with metallopeptidase domain
MDTLLQVGLSNAAVATFLALIAGVATIFCRRRPALVHGLWLLVLLKLLTPPLARVPVPNPIPAREATTIDNVADLPDQKAELPDVADNANKIDAARLAAANVDDSALDFGSDTDPPALPADFARKARMPAEATIPSWILELPDWQPMLVVLWIVGSLGWFLLAGTRLARFGRLLRHARVAPPAVQDEADRIAIALGMRWCPVVQLLPGRLPPMLWAGLGTPRLLMPADLLGQMEPEGISTLMAHELAHLRRGDYRVRLVEFLAMGLFWWHPVVWIARRALREAEEQCCDAWVVSALPGTGKTYASALLETLDFLSAAPASPPLACGIGHVSDLKRRLTMIMRGATPRALCWREVLAVLGLATLLPLLPTLARADDPQEEPARKARSEEKKSDEKKVFVIHKDEKSPEVERAKAELKGLEAELQRKLAEVREVSQRLKEAAEKIHHVEMDRAKVFANDMAKNLKEKISKELMEKVGKEIHVEVDGKELKGRKMLLEGPIEIEVTVDGQTHVRHIENGNRVRVQRVQPAPEPKPAAAPAPAVAPVSPVPPIGPSRVATPERTESGRGVTSRRTENRTETREGRDGDRRMEQLERKLDAVMRELEKLRQEKAESQSKDKEKEMKERKNIRKRSSQEDEEDSF